MSPEKPEDVEGKNKRLPPGGSTWKAQGNRAGLKEHREGGKAQQRGEGPGGQ